MNVGQLIRVLQEYPSYFPVTDKKFNELKIVKEVYKTNPSFPKRKVKSDIILMLE